MKITKKFLKQLIKEEIENIDGKKRNYMFFQNINTIKNCIREIELMEQDKLDELLNEHPWAIDHISTSADDIEEVFNFLKEKLL
jgi:hypothetical protein